jgi:hypothetical protein
MVEFAVFAVAEPARREKARHVFALGPFCHTNTHTNKYSKYHTNKNPPITAPAHSLRQHLPARYATPSVAAYYNVHHSVSFSVSFEQDLKRTKPTGAAGSSPDGACIREARLLSSRRGKRLRLQLEPGESNTAAHLKE